VQTDSLLLGSSTPLPPERVVDVAQRLRGVPYHWGGETPNGLDCSGYIEQVFALAGYHVPRLADAQFAATVEVSAEQMRPGDLVFFTTYLPGPSHVGIYIGERHFLHASSSHGVTESSLDEPYYAQRFLGAHRIPEWSGGVSKR
jgi:cell wall-associated NlpC family hydrolase